MHLNDNVTKYAIEKDNEEQLITIRSLNQIDIFFSILKNGFNYHRIGPTENYWDIALDYYNDQDYWVPICYVNMTSPFDLVEGDTIIIPNLE